MIPELQGDRYECYRCRLLVEDVEWSYVGSNTMAQLCRPCRGLDVGGSTRQPGEVL